MPTYPQDLYDAAAAVLPNAYAPYSHFLVASALRSTSGVIFTGVNVENVSYSLTCCAEGNAISSMVTSGDSAISEVLILVPGSKLCPPCGACRQIILEFADPDCVIHLCTKKGHSSKHTLADLLPLTFDSGAF